MRRLPPLTAIEAFVQVARTGSVKGAAQELALSAPALSRRIQALERFIGRPLFERRHQAVALNADGERLLQDIAPVLDRLSDAVEAMTSGTEMMRLRLGVLPLFAAQTLFPRMATLRAKYPQLHLDIDTAGHAMSRVGDGIDVAIVLAREPDPSLYSVRLDRNQVHAIGARSLTEGPDPVVRPEQMAGLTALIHRDMADTFGAWRHAAGLDELEPAAFDHFDSGLVMLEAAAQGMGVAFMHATHLDGAQDPRIVSLFGIEVASPYSHWFVCRPRAMQLRAVRVFHDWVMEVMGVTP